jgi:small-conductance mechanosensitive channel
VFFEEFWHRLQGLWHNPRSEDLLIGSLLILSGYVLASGLRAALMRTLGHRLSAHQRLIFGRALFYLVFGLFVITGLREMGFKLSVFLGAAGVLTVAIGFASQTSASNLISGLFLIGEGAFAVGDLISVTTVRGQVIEGKVLSIDLMSVKLLTLDNVYIRLPNELLIRTPLLNMTRFPIRRLSILLSIRYEENLGKVRQVLLQLARDYPLILDEPKSIVTVQGFGEASIELLYAVWVQCDNYLKVRDVIQESIRDAFVQHGVQLPLRQLQVRQADEAAGSPGA